MYHLNDIKLPKTLAYSTDKKHACFLYYWLMTPQLRILKVEKVKFFDQMLLLECLRIRHFFLDDFI